MTTISILVILAIALHFFLKAAKKHADRVNQQVKETFKNQQKNGKIFRR